nr:hypothetical protein [uncultured Rhodoferax sp.]
MAIAATHSATPSLQMTLNKARLEQAKREALKAEDELEALQLEAEQTEQEVYARRMTVRELDARVAWEDTTYNSQLRATRSSVPPATQDFLVRMYTATSLKFAASGNPLRSSLNSRPYTNTLGQSTGRIVDLAA